jgi:hypothetical protein
LHLRALAHSPAELRHRSSQKIEDVPIVPVATSRHARAARQS